ncbi:MAG: glycosyltransferase family 2 protein [Planctomycetales bacterium]|nr:glycosyltransferase family 2 protein [Planctomycetales bacterium]
MSDTLFVSVVVPVRNEAKFIRHTLCSLINQQYASDRSEILVVDGRSTDSTREIVKEFAKHDSNVRLLDNPKQWSSAARNIGIREARGDVVVIVDGHCDIPTDTYLANLAHAFEKSNAGIVGRPQTLNVEHASPLQQAIAIARASRLGHHPDSFIYSSESQFVPASSVGTAYRREVFDRIGMFDESFDACEDVELNTRADNAGEKCYFTETVGIRYYPRASLRALFRQMKRYGRGRVRLARKHSGTASWKSFAPALFVAGLLLGPVSLILPSFFFYAYLVAVLTYVLVVAMTSVMLTLTSGVPSHLWRLPAVFVTVHFGAGWGLLTELIFGKSKPIKT